MYTTNQLIADAAKEAKLLKKHASKSELIALRIDELAASNIHKCIYGQMTGDCFSNRAAELIQLCTPRYFTHAAIAETAQNTIATIARAANGQTVKDFKNNRIGRGGYSPIHFSAIEVYITWIGAKNDNLIAYLRGETKKLIL